MIKKRLLSLFMIIAMVGTICFGTVPIFADTLIYDISAAQDGSIQAILDTESGLFKISGSGNIKDYANWNVLPWYSNRGLVKKVIFDSDSKITHIGSHLFEDMLYLTEIDIPNSVISIGEGSFYGTSLKEIVIPEGVKSIGQSAFKMNNVAEKIYLPSTVEVIKEGAFSGCPLVSEISILSENTSGYSKSVFCSFDDKGNITIPIGNDVSGIKKATVSAKAGYQIEVLETFGFMVEKIGTSSENDKWLSYPSDMIWDVGKTSEDDVKAYFNIISGSMNFIGYGEIEDSRDGEAAYREYQDSIKSVVFDDRITRIGDYAFSSYIMYGYWPISLISVKFPSSLESIGVGAFYCASNLRSINLPEGLREIDRYAFGRVTVNELYLPSSIETFNSQKVSSEDPLRVMNLIVNKASENQELSSSNFTIDSDAEVYLYSANTSMLTLAQESVTSEEQIHFLDNVSTSGTLDNGIKWFYDIDTNTLSFDTTNATSTSIPSYEYGNQPWAGAFYNYGSATRYDFGGVSSIGGGAFAGFSYGSIGHIDYYGSNALGFGSTLSSQTGVSSTYGGSSLGGGSVDNENNNTGGTTATGIEVYTKDYNESDFEKVKFPDAQPFIMNNVVYTPIRFINEDLGALVSWNNNTQTATLTFSENGVKKKVRLKPDTTEMEIEIDGSKTTIELGATIVLKENRLFLPGEEIVKAWSDWEFSKDRESITLYKDYYTRVVAPVNVEPDEEDGVLVTDENISQVLRTFDNTAIIVNQQATNFKVTVPFVVNISMNAEAEITVSEGLSVKNESAWGPILIKQINVITRQDWAIGDFENADFVNMLVDSRVLGLSINDSPVKTDGSVALNNSLSETVKYQSEKELFFDAKLPAQSRAYNDSVAAIIFTLDWDKV